MCIGSVGRAGWVLWMGVSVAALGCGGNGDDATSGLPTFSDMASSGGTAQTPPSSPESAPNAGSGTEGPPRDVPLTGGMVPAATGMSGSTSLDCSAAPLTGGSQHCSSNASGTVDGLAWLLWSSGSGGCLTTYGVGGALKATWNNSGDFLARIGLQWNETKTFDQYGVVSADFAYTKTGNGGGFSYIGVYGWSNNPLVEYYIVEDWFGRGPPTGNGTLKGSFDVDGSTYKIYTHTQTNQPSLHGTATFQQFYSVRQAPRQCGHVSISDHYAEWASLGMNLGKMSEARVLVEAGGGVGSIDFTTANVTAQ
jgi:endo-1,4-beta-xylanase